MTEAGNCQATTANFEQRPMLRSKTAVENLKRTLSTMQEQLKIYSVLCCIYFQLRETQNPNVLLNERASTILFRRSFEAGVSSIVCDVE